MNIRSLTSPAPPIYTSKITEASNAIKSHDATERDADGRQPFGEKKRKITPEELEILLENLKAHPGVVANNLTVELVSDDTLQYIVIKDPSGHIIRRVNEDDFYQLVDSLDQTNGRIFDKVA